MAVMEIIFTESCLCFVTECIAQWWTEQNNKLMEIPLWWITWYGVPGRQVRQLIQLSARYAAWCARSLCATPNARFGAKSPALQNNLKHCNQKIIKSIVHGCIALFRITMHELFLLLLTLFLISIIEFLIKTLLINLINIIIIILFLIFLDFAYYCLH